MKKEVDKLGDLKVIDGNNSIAFGRDDTSSLYGIFNFQSMYVQIL